MQNKESPKGVCKKCRDLGYVMVYEAPHVKRKYCVCETGKKREEFIKKQTKTKDVEPIWELFTL